MNSTRAHEQRGIGRDREIDPQVDIEDVEVRGRQVNARELARDQRHDQRRRDHDREIDRGRDEPLPEADHVHTEAASRLLGRLGRSSTGTGSSVILSLYGRAPGEGK